ncbi:MAG: F0F1 ATP synthase subunit B [Candidatus Omnitrophica bacterium]|nr:F0F1 ATP synthase subunit B [Candidatus Omnitrophota bacterium]
MELLKLLSANEIIAQGVCFLLLLAVLRVFLWNRFLKLLDARKERIASELKAIETAKADVEKLKSGYDGRIARIEEEAREKIQSAIIEGKKAAQEVREKAQEDAERLFEKTRENIKVEAAKAEERLKNKIVDIAIEAAEKVIEEKLSEAGDRKLVEGFINKLERR